MSYMRKRSGVFGCSSKQKPAKPLEPPQPQEDKDTTHIMNDNDVKKEFPCLILDGMDDWEQKTLKKQLHDEYRAIRNKFDILVVSTQNELNRRSSMTPKYLKESALFKDLGCKAIKNAGDFDSIFTILKENYYWTWFHFDTLKDIIAVCLPDGFQKFDDYNKEFEMYCRRSLFKCPKEIGKYSKKYSTPLLVKVDDEVFKNSNIKQYKKIFETALVTILNLKRNLVLLTYNEGCTQLVYSIQISEARRAFPLSQKQKEKLAEIGVKEYYLITDQDAKKLNFEQDLYSTDATVHLLPPNLQDEKPLSPTPYTVGESSPGSPKHKLVSMPSPVGADETKGERKSLRKAQPTPSDQGPSQREATESHRPAVPLVQPNQQQRQQAQLDKSGEDETDSPVEEPRFPEEHKENIAKEKKPDPKDTVKHEAVIKDFAKDIKIIIQCCNENEYYACLDRMEPPITGPTGEKMFNRSVLYPFGDDEDGYPTIVLGMFAKRKAAIVWTKQAARGEADLKRACSIFPNSKAIIAVGVCYGRDRKTVEFCDVLVSSQIVDLSVTKIDAEGKIIIKDGGTHNTNRVLRNIFCIDAVGWEFTCVETPERKSKAVVGQLLSAPILLNNEEGKKKLMKKYEDAKGGEMEGCVLYTKDIADRCIVIKGVSDYADGKKNDKWQLTAAMAAADYTHYMLEKSIVFR